MKLLLYLSFCFTGYLVYAANFEITTLCHLGDIIQDKGNLTTLPCDFANGFVCQTKFETRTPLQDQENFTSIVYECAQGLSCLINRGGRFNNKCDPGENGVRQCYACCRTHLCNNATEIPPLAPLF